MVLELPLDTIILIIGFAASILAILGVGYKIGLWAKGIKRDVKGHSLVLKTVVDVFVELRKKLIDQEAITIETVVNAFSEASEKVSDSVIESYFSGYGEKLGNPNTHREQRKRELLEKARRKQISYAEAEELRRLLEEQKRQHEASGDIGGAILVGLLILFLLGVIGALFGGKRK